MSWAEAYMTSNDSLKHGQKSKPLNKLQDISSHNTYYNIMDSLCAGTIGRLTVKVYPHSEDIMPSKGLESLKAVVLPSETKRIPEQCFIDCKKLETCPLPPNLEYIGSQAFEDTNLSSIVIPESVLGIGEYAFREIEVKSLKSVIFKGTPKKLGAGIFDGCTSLKDIYVPWSEGYSSAFWNENAFGGISATIHYDSISY